MCMERFVTNLLLWEMTPVPSSKTMVLFQVTGQYLQSHLLVDWYNSVSCTLIHVTVGVWGVIFLFIILHPVGYSIAEMDSGSLGII